MREIILDGPGKNALSSALIEKVLVELREASGAPLLLTGAGEAFCAGLNLKELVAFDVAGFESYLRKFESLVEALYTYPGPTVAWVNGHAIAGGCVLAQCCDHAVGSSRASVKIGMNEVALGLRFPSITLAVVREQIPRTHQNELLLGARLYGPVDALRLGLVDELADDGGQLARRRLAELSAHPALVYAQTKAELRGALLEEAEGEDRFRKVLAAWTAPEVKKRIEEFLKPRA